MNLDHSVNHAFLLARTRQFGEAQYLHGTFGSGYDQGQSWLPPPSLDRFPTVPVREPTRRERLEAETELFGYAVSGHPLELYDDIAWDKYWPVARLGDHISETVVTCGLVVEQRTHHQVTGEPMKFVTLADWTGMMETELFAKTHKNYGLATVRYSVMEFTATVKLFEKRRGFTLREVAFGSLLARTRTYGRLGCPQLSPNNFAHSQTGGWGRGWLAESGRGDSTDLFRDQQPCKC